MNTLVRRLLVVIAVFVFSVISPNGFGAAARITNLNVPVVRGESATISWTAPTSTVALVRYDIRMSTNPITALNWSSATSIAPATDWLYNDVQYQANLVTNGYTQVVYILPAPGTTLDSRVTFSWSPVELATQYALEVLSNGRMVAKYQAGSDTAISVPIPVTGAPIVIRVWYRVGTTWSYTEFDYMAPSVVPLPLSVVSVSPEPGSAIVSPGKFAWNLVANATEYWVELGSGISGNDLYNKSTRKDNFVSIPNIPQDGRLLHLTVWWKIGWTWYSTGFVYEADIGSDPFSEITEVISSSNPIMSPCVFAWNPVAGADEYWVEMGSALGGKELYNKSTGTDTSVAIRNIPQDGRDLFLRIWYKLSSVVTRVQGSTEELVVFGLDVGQTYYFAVRTLDRSNVWSPISNVLSFETRESAGTTSVGLTWSPNKESDLAGYKLYRGTIPDQYDYVQDVGLSTVVTSNGLEYGKTYYFFVTAYNKDRLESQPSNVVTFTP